MKYRYWIFIFVLYFSGNPIAFAQFSEIGKPFIDNYSPRNYRHENQNYSIAQGIDGLMYFGNLNGILQYDGQTWRYLEYKGKPYLSSTPKGKIYVGGYRSFGELVNTPNYKMEYHALSDAVFNAGFSFEHVTQLMSFDENIVVVAPPHVFVISPDQSVEHILRSNNSIKLFGGKEPLLLIDSGLFKINLSKFDTTACACTHHHVIQNIIPFKNQYLIHLKDDTWKVVDDKFNFVKPFVNQASEIVKGTRDVSGIYLSNGMFAFGTSSCGIVIVDSIGQYVTHINQNNGLNDNDVHQLFEDKHHNIWVAMNNGISLLKYPSVFTVFDQNYGIKGGVFDIIRFNGRLYIASTQGLYASPGFDRRETCQPSKFEKVDQLDIKFRKFLNINERLFMTSQDGIFELIGEHLVKISSVLAFGLSHSEEFKNVIYVAGQDGLYFFDISKGFVALGKLKGLDTDIRTVAEDIEGNLWLGTNYEGVFKVDFHGKFSINAQVKQFKENSGLPVGHSWVDVFKTHKGIYFSTYKGMFSFNKKKKVFDRDFLIDSDTERWYYPLSEDAQGNLWFSSGLGNAFERQSGMRYYIPEKDSFVNVTQPFNQIRDYTIEIIYPDENSVVWFGTFDGLLRFDSKKMSRLVERFLPKIRVVQFGKDSLIDPSLVLNLIIEMPYRLNSVTFQVSTPYYQPQDVVLFQYKLEGLNEEWSTWQSSFTEQYSGLIEGQYTFKVRSKNIHDVISEPTQFSFTIKPPFYRTWWAYTSYFVLLTSFIYMLFRYRAYLYAKEKNELERIIRDKTEEIVIQKERAEELVKNILPEDTARELQTKGRATRKKYDLVTVLFSDIQGFTQIAEGMNPEKLLDEFDRYVMHFDQVVEKYDIEKIKTIGDAYMCAGGLPKKNKTNPIEVVLAGLQMIHFAKEIQQTSEFNWGMRFGVHTGPVIAGVVGTKKMSYDIWGDTVNIASRMESYGEVGQLNISESTFELVSSYFVCEHRGKVPVKYKGNMDMYFVIGLKEEFAADETRVFPNRKFELKLQNIRFDVLEDLILTKLEKGLNKRLYYHNVKHTIDVVNQVEVIGKGEGVSDEELIILKTAALFHDLGHTISFIDHEEQGIIFAKDILPNFNYSTEQIEMVSELIYATKFPPEPKNRLQEIICDADLDYLGRTDFLPTSNNLYLEMFEHGKIKNRKEWNDIQISFLRSHQYYTDTARRTREVNKQEQLKKIIDQASKDESKY